MTERERSSDSKRQSEAAVVSLSTRELNTLEGQDRWTDTLDRLYCEVDVAWPTPRDHFDAEWGGRPFGDLHVSTIRAGAHTIVRSPAMIESDAAGGYLVVLVTDGQAEIAQGGRTAVLDQGAFTLLDCDQPFVFRTAADFRQVVIRMPRSLLATRLPGPLAELGTARKVGEDTGAGAIASRYFVDLASVDSPIAERPAATFASCALDMLATALTVTSTATDAADAQRALDLARIQRTIENRLHDPELTLSNVASECSMSLRTAQKLFSASGTTPAHGSSWHDSSVPESTSSLRTSPSRRSASPPASGTCRTSVARSAPLSG